MKKSAFFDFLNRRTDLDFSGFLNKGKEDQDYINWNDFLLPSHYGNPEQEYRAIRNESAIFDVSPIRKIRISGPGAGRLLDYTLTRPVSGSPCMRGIYVAFCNADGSLKDDSILYKFSENDYLLMPSDINHIPYLQSLCDQLALDVSEVTLQECTDDWCGLAIQGPLSAIVLRAMGFADVEHIKPFDVVDYGLAGSTIKIARMGFTADLGYECWFANDLIEVVQQAIEQARVKLNIDLPGYGLSALEACRLEGGFVVAGWDFATEVDPDPEFKRSPYEVGLGWLVNLQSDDFVGKQALQQEQNNGQKWFHRTFQIDPQQEHENGGHLYKDMDGPLYATINDKLTEIGAINCFAWSWCLQKTIGNASILAKYKDLTEALLLANNCQYRVQLRKGAHINLERRNEMPARINN